MSQNEVPLLYRALTTRRSSYPTWILLCSSPLPIPVKRTHLGNDICSMLVSSQRAVIVPPSISNIADSLGWLLVNAPFPLATCYGTVVKQLYFACLPTSHHIHPFNAHEKILLIAISSFINSACEETYYTTIQSLKRYINSRWGHRIPFVPFNEAVLETYGFLKEVRYNKSLLIYFSSLLLLT